MPYNDGIRATGPKNVTVAGESARRCRKRGLRSKDTVFCSSFWKLAVCGFLFSRSPPTAAAAAATQQQQQQQERGDSRGQRAGDVAGLEDGRISLAKVTSMLTSSVHMELAGSEDAFGRLLDHEWDRFSARPAGTRSTFVVCSAPGRANAKRLRELAGGDSLVQTLHRRKGEILCSFASLDGASAALVAADGGGGGGGGQGTFSLEPLPHLAKLAPAVAADPSSAALLLSSEAAGATQGVYIDEGGGSRLRGRRHLRAAAGGAGRSEVSAEQRDQILASAAAATAAGLPGDDRPTTQRLIEHGERGMVDAIEISLGRHHVKRSKGETEEMARRWLSLASDQPALAKALREEHFWGGGGSRRQEDGVMMGGSSSGSFEEEGEGRRRLSTEEEERARHVFAHEERKRLGWVSLLEAVGGRGGESGGQGSSVGEPGGAAGGTRASYCGFDLARFTVSPSGKKVLLHRPHEMVAAANDGGGGGGDEGCLSALLAFFSLQPEVRYVTARRKTATQNLDAAWVTQSAVDGYTPLWDENLQGQDEIIGVADTGLDLNHCQFREDDGDNIEASDWDDPVTDLDKRKVVQYIDFVDDFDEADGHGTHVAGSICGAQSGDDAGDDDADGMAFQGKLAVFDFGDSDNFNALTTPDEIDAVILEPAYDGGARVHSNSWDTVSTEYTALSNEVDEFVYTHQNMLVVFAAGNCGDTSTDDLIDNCSVLDDDEGTVLSPAQGKNVVAVGSSESGGVTGKDMDTVSYFSSKGPTIDGRIKPDVVAPGDPTWSAAADTTGETCEFGSQTGTSMSTPIVAGNGAMARQYFREGWYNTGSKNESLGFDPSGALLKAVLINSATGMSFAGVNPDSGTLDVTLTTPPDTHQGFGRVTMINALNINSTVGIFFEDWVEIREGETIDYDVSLYEDADTDKDLRITLVWTDPPASVGSTEALIHDLDLVVIAESTGTEYYPNGLEEADTVNNVEKITITDTTQGENYIIRVSCNELSEYDTQNFAVIANGEFIKTNALPTAQDPSDWADLVDQAADTLLTWKFAAALSLGVFACCAAACACRSCNKSRRHRSKVNRYRREITANRGGGGGGAPGRKLRPNPPARPQPYAGPVRNPGSLYVSGSARFQESWRRPGPGSIGGRSMRSMRSEQSARGALLTGAGAVVPGQVTSATAPASPPHEACPECGLRLPDVVQLVKHVETQHGGRANRKKPTATAVVAAAAGNGPMPGLKVVKARAVNNGGNPYGDGVPVVAVAPSKNVPGRVMTGNPYADARASAVEVEAKPAPSATSPTSRARRASATHRQAPVAGTAVVVTMAAAAGGAAAASRGGRNNRTPTRVRSSSPAGASGTSSGRSGSSAKRSPGNPSGSGSGHSRSPASSSSKPGGSRDGLPRIRDLSSHGKNNDGSKASGDGGGHSGKSPLPRLLSHRRDGRGNGSGETASRVYRPSRGAGGSGGSGSGSGSRSSGETLGRHSAEVSKPRSKNESGSSGGRRQSRGLEETAPGFERSGRTLLKNESTRSLTRTSSLDRMSALSSRAITRSTLPKEGMDEDDEAQAPPGRGVPGAVAACERDMANQRRIRHSVSTEDHIPVGQRLTADKLRALGSGLAPPVFSPVMPSAKEPAYSPVARKRAGELDEKKPVGITRKFFRQLSGEG
ncbi:unnamed protein product [Ectocarpus sp. 6 AP-2014]